MPEQLPDSLLSSLKTVVGFDEKNFIKVHLSDAQITSVRINPEKIFDIQQLDINIQETVPWSSNGYYLSERPSFTSDPIFHAGGYYVQEASSMFLEEVVRQTCDLSRSLKVLDLCAAPGGKSTLLQSIISGQSLLVSNEVIKARVNILSENLTKWGAANVVITNNDPKDFQRLREYFDVIVVDAPCSGSGLFRKDPEAISQWSPENVRLCSQRQERILADVLPSLKIGGILIYSTCSYSTEEDESICDWLLSGSGHELSAIQLKLKNEWNIIETRSSQHNIPGYRFYPDKVRGEGFFITVLRKENGQHIEEEIKLKNRPALLNKAEKELINPLVINAASFSFFKWQQDIIAVPENLLKDVVILQSNLYLKKAGVRLGSVIRNELIPDHEFALSDLATGKFMSVEADLPSALQYLRRGELEIETGHIGWALLKYKTLALGWIKILPHRINNYYPKTWRILNR